MLRRNATLVGSTITGVLLFLACNSELPTASQTTTLANSDGDSPQVLARIYTGRDSFGVAVKVKVEGTVGSHETDGCVELSGSGHGAHMGPTDITQVYCSDESGEIEGTFRYEGKHDQFISGEYDGSITSRTDGNEEFEGRFAITDGELNAVKIPIHRVKDEKGNQLWNGTISGSVGAEEFSIEVNGKVLQHVNEDVNAGVTRAD